MTITMDSAPFLSLQPVSSEDRKRVESIARLLVRGCRCDPDEQVIDATREPIRLPNGTKILDPATDGPYPLWHMFIADASRVVDAFGTEAIDMALAMVRT